MRLPLETRHTLVLCLVAGGLVTAPLAAQIPVMHKVVPEIGQIGSVMKAQGVFLGKAEVEEVYLSDHTFDMKVKVLDQSDDAIQFRVPPFAKPGRLQLVIKTSGKEPFIMEQPVYVTIEEPKVAEAKDAKEDAKDAKEEAKDAKKDAREATLQANATAPPPAPSANGTK